MKNIILNQEVSYPKMILSKCYRYRAYLPTVNAHLVNEQFSLSHRYYNRLIEIKKKFLTDVDVLIKQDSKVSALLTEIEATEDKEVKKPLWKLYRQAYKSAKEGLASKIDELNEVRKQSIKDARAENGLYWGNYTTVEADAQSAVKFKRWTGEGRLGVQLQKGASIEKLLGTNTLLQISSIEGRNALCKFRVGSDNQRQAVFVEIPFVYHRPLPTNAKVKWVHFSREKVGTKFQYFLIFSLEVEMTAKKGRSSSVAIDLGWRRRDKDIRSAYWYADEDNHGELLVPGIVFEMFQKSDDLRGIRENNFNEIKGRLILWKKETLCIPEWLQEKIQTISKWKFSAERLAAIVLRWRKERFSGDEEIFQVLENWRKQDKHLYEWEANQRRKAMARRDEVYKIFASQIAKKYDVVVLEIFNLAKMAEKVQGKSHSNQRFTSAAGKLRLAIINACDSNGSTVVQVPAAYTTQTCVYCKHIAKKSAELYHTCPGCGVMWDRDYNASRNLLDLMDTGDFISRGKIDGKQSQRFANRNKNKLKGEVPNKEIAGSDENIEKLEESSYACHKA